MSDQEAESSRVKLRTNGDMTVNENGTPEIIAHYDSKTGTLEFISHVAQNKWYAKCVDRIGTTAQGTAPSGKIVKNILVKGVEGERPAANAPKRPRPGELGDAAEDQVQWYLDNDLPQAIARYGIYVDSQGRPVRKKCKRKVTFMTDNRSLDDGDLEAFKDGKNSQVKAPVNLEAEMQEFPQGIVARRATALTFTPNEVVGGFQADEEEYAPVAGEEGEE